MLVSYNCSSFYLLYLAPVNCFPLQRPDIMIIVLLTSNDGHNTQREKYHCATIFSCYFKYIFFLKNKKNAVKFTRMPFASTSCSVDLVSCTITESKKHVKPHKGHVKSSRELRKIILKIYKIIFSECNCW